MLTCYNVAATVWHGVGAKSCSRTRLGAVPRRAQVLLLDTQQALVQPISARTRGGERVMIMNGDSGGLGWLAVVNVLVNAALLAGLVFLVVYAGWKAFLWLRRWRV